jgi:beta-xylosidase
MSDFLKVDKPDTIPPTSPVITSVTYKNRSVILKWNRSYSSDVKKHYVVRFSDNTIDTIASFIEQTEMFIDKKLGNVNKYEYTVISVDNSNNHSRNNKRVSVKIPKRAIALKGVFNAKVDRDKGAIVLNLRYSASKTKMIYIYRAEADGRYRMIKSMYDIGNIYEDRNVKANTTYKYRVRATFNDGTSSKMSDEIVVNY